MKGKPDAAVRLHSLLVELAKEPGEAASAAAERLLEPLVRYFNGAGRAAYGRKKALAVRMSELTGRSVTRDMVRGWLHPDPAKRRQPSFGYGLLLLVAAAGQMEPA